MARQTATLDDLFKGQQALQVTVSDLFAGFKSMQTTMYVMKDDMDALKTGQLGLKAGLRDLAEYAVSGFETINERFDRLEDRMDRVESILDGSTYQR